MCSIFNFCSTSKKHLYNKIPNISFMLKEPLLQEESPLDKPSPSVKDNEIYIVSRDVLYLVGEFKKRSRKNSIEIARCV